MNTDTNDLTNKFRKLTPKQRELTYRLLDQMIANLPIAWKFRYWKMHYDRYITMCVWYNTYRSAHE